MGKRFGLALGIGPEQVMGEFVIDRLHPHTFTFVNPATFPVLRMNEVNAAILERASGRFTPIDIFVPFDTRLAQMIKSAELRNRAAESSGAALMEKLDEIAINLAALFDRGQ